MDLAQVVERSQPDHILKGINPAERTAAILERVSGSEESGIVPVAQLCMGKTGQPDNMIRAKRAEHARREIASVASILRLNERARHLANDKPLADIRKGQGDHRHSVLVHSVLARSRGFHLL